jgi:hypothetical protein
MDISANKYLYGVELVIYSRTLVTSGYQGGGILSSCVVSVKS